MKFNCGVKSGKYFMGVFQGADQGDSLMRLLEALSSSSPCKVISYTIFIL
jgi:hypothetical protein